MTATDPASPELTAAMAETRVVREQLGEVLGRFLDTRSSGWTARVSGTQLRRWHEHAGLPMPASAPPGKPVTPYYELELDLATALDERDEAREQLATTQAIARALQGLAIEVITAYTSQLSCDETPHDRSLVARWRATAGLDDSAALGDGG